MRNQKGIAIFLTVIIIGAAALIIALGLGLSGIDDLENSFIFAKSGEVFSVADGCTEETLRRIRLDTNYGIGEGSINLSGSGWSCIITVDSSGSNRTVVAVGTIGNYNKKIQVDLSLNGNVITLNNRTEIE